MVLLSWELEVATDKKQEYRQRMGTAGSRWWRWLACIDRGFKLAISRIHIPCQGRWIHLPECQGFKLANVKGYVVLHGRRQFRQYSSVVYTLHWIMLKPVSLMSFSFSRTSSMFLSDITHSMLSSLHSLPKEPRASSSFLVQCM